MTKQELRTEYLKLRLALSQEEHLLLSKKIVERFFSSVDLSNIKTIHTFLPIVSKNEIDTWLIIDRLKKDFPLIKISIPRVESNHMVNFYFENENQLEKNKWNIPEPKSGELTPTEKIDLVIVPLLAFDKTGSRVGYGKGFYDKFLKECRSDCEKIGLSFFEPVDEFSNVDLFDVKLTACVTPEKTYAF